MQFTVRGGPADVVAATHDPRLVVLSVVISILGAYAAIELMERSRDARGRPWKWLAGAAVVDAIGTWSMHYTAKLALRLPGPLYLDWRLVVLSLLVGIGGSAAALLVVGRKAPSWPRALAAGVLLGCVGIEGVHYTAMAAVVQPRVHYYHSPVLVMLSILLAVAIACVSLPLTFRWAVAAGGRHPFRIGASAVVRGLGNPAMHYTAMAAMALGYGSGAGRPPHTVSIASIGVLGISIVPVTVLAVGLVTSFIAEKRAEEVLRLFPRRLMEAQETERQHIARELHDEVGQVLTGVGMSLGGIQGLPPERQATAIAEARGILDELTIRIRNLALDLRPSMLDDFGLVHALQTLFRRYEQQTGIEVRFEHPGIDEHRFRPEIEIAAYRIVQEALTNVARHARAKEAEVRISCDGERLSGALLSIEVQDRGAGFDSTRLSQETVGLAGMRERASAAGGELTLTSSPHHGTRVAARLPLRAEGEER